MGIYNNSKLKLYETCPRLFYLGSVLNLRRKSTYANLDRDEGSLMHEMLALWMNPDDPHRDDLVRDCINTYYERRVQEAELDVEATENGSEHLYYGYDGDYAESFGGMSTGELIEVAEFMIGKWREVRSRALVDLKDAQAETPEPFMRRATTRC